MPRPSKGARLYWRKDTGQWAIVDGKDQRRTGTADRREAEARLAEYIAERDRGSRAGGPADPSDLLIADALQVYLEEHAPHAAAPERIAYAVTPLIDFWGALPVSAVTKATCRRYAAERKRSDGTVRRELTTLRAALNYAHGEGRLLHVPTVHLPDRPPSKERWLTREEAARILRAARRSDKVDKRGRRQQTDRGRHLAYFILIALYTGTRKQAILSLRFEPHTAGGWIDCESGVLYRSAQDARVTNKRRGSVKMPAKLLGHMRRLKAAGNTWAVQYQGGRIGDVQTAWERACRDAEVDGASPHTLKHTAITWGIQGGMTISGAASFFSTSAATIEKVYWHHSPMFQEAEAEAMNRRLK